MGGTVFQLERAHGHRGLHPLVVAAVQPHEIHGMRLLTGADSLRAGLQLVQIVRMHDRSGQVRILPFQPLWSATDPQHNRAALRLEHCDVNVGSVQPFLEPEFGEVGTDGGYTSEKSW